MNIIFYLPLFTGFCLNIIAVPQVRKRAELLLRYPYSPLPDIIHINFPRIPHFIPDYFLWLCGCVAIFNYNYLIFIEKNLLCLGFCTIIRSFSMFLTIMPTCMPMPFNEVNTTYYYKWFLSTHDLMFSGHSLIFIFIGNILNNNFIKITGPLVLVMARYHYTIDVCVSGLVYFFVYSNI